MIEAASASIAGFLERYVLLTTVQVLVIQGMPDNHLLGKAGAQAQFRCRLCWPEPMFAMIGGGRGLLVGGAECPDRGSKGAESLLALYTGERHHGSLFRI
ncbi:MAG: hypothetical protein WBD65_07040, partial [Methylocella sp.]